MIKLVALLKRRGDLSPEEFKARYEGDHAHLIRHIPGVVRYARRYVVPVEVWGADEVATESPQDVDAITEIWFASLEDFDRARQELAAEELAQLFATESAELFDTEATRRYLVVEERDSVDPR